MNAPALLFFIFGFLVIIVGAELLVRGASRLSRLAGISPLVVGLTVVAFGTSSPELAVSLQSVLAGYGDLALGNVVGSNIFNVLFVLGACALLAPLLVADQLIRLEVPFMIGVSFVLWAMGGNGRVGRLEGCLLFTALIGYTMWTIRQSRRSSPAVQREFAQEFADQPRAGRGAIALQLGFVIGGLALLVLGSRWLVDGAGAIAAALGVSELIVGLTIVAAGTSLPEVATSVVASIRGERDIAVGNVVGSNLFNILGVLGVAAAVSPDGVTVSRAAINFDIPVMCGVAVACLPIFFTGHVISRWEGGVFLSYYAAYTLFLVLDATQHDLLPAFSGFMGAFVIPLTVITLLLFLIRALRHNSPSAPRRG